MFDKYGLGGRSNLSATPIVELRPYGRAKVGLQTSDSVVSEPLNLRPERWINYERTVNTPDARQSNFAFALRLRSGQSITMVVTQRLK